ncbi:hypothetical protein Cylst_0195 [Cylindrospermum stagnale PCC 7417]|uniref:Uncharacterized protein n=1 Tax=Cylindrospermum stagnale PCC 7417 TaxID=56107 RepID=K9WS35_9NOST|nr:hypothetical protein Cylst_0195 [Cylindrospermum stagnale PCC 7417]
MTTINKIDLQVLVQLLQRANLISGNGWIFQPDRSTVCSMRKLSAEVRADLASQLQLFYTKNYMKPIALHQSQGQSVRAIEIGYCE